MKVQLLLGIGPKIREILQSTFCHLSYKKWCLFTILISSGKDVFHKSNLQMMKIDSKYNFLKPYFLITKNKAPASIYLINLQIEC